MPSSIILCKDCQREKERLERGGAVEVVECKPLPGEENKPEAERKCRIKWKNKPL